MLVAVTGPRRPAATGLIDRKIAVSGTGDAIHVGALRIEAYAAERPAPGLAAAHTRELSEPIKGIKCAHYLRQK